MKRKFGGFVAVTAIASLIAAGPVSQVRAQTVGDVAQLINYAYNTPPGGSRGPIWERDPVVQRSTIDTPRNSALVVSFVDDTELTIGESSSVTIDEFVFDPAAGGDKALINVTKGALRYVSGNISKDAVQIETPTAIIGIRGTIFTLFYDIVTGITRIWVTQGAVSMRSKASGRTVSVGEQQTAAVNPDGTVEPATQGYPSAPDRRVNKRIERRPSAASSRPSDGGRTAPRRENSSSP